MIKLKHLLTEQKAMSAAFAAAIKQAKSIENDINNNIPGKGNWGVTLNLQNYQDVDALYISIGDKEYLPKTPSEVKDPRGGADDNLAMTQGPVGTRVLILKNKSNHLDETKLFNLLADFINKLLPKTRNYKLGHPKSYMASVSEEDRVKTIKLLHNKIKPLIANLKNIDWKDYKS